MFSNTTSKIASKLGLSQPTQSFKGPPPSNVPTATTYNSNPVPIPSSFLTKPPSTPITIQHIDFESSPLPLYKGHTALILDNVLSPEECQQLIKLAEDSVPREEGDSPWKPALVSLGYGLEARPPPGYRESDRIIWDQQTIVDRLWERCAQADGLKDLLATVERERWRKSGKWEFRRFNQRMRFLKYSAGQFFKPHSDGPYFYEEDKREFQTHYTVHLYLNNSAENDPESDLTGGATSFLSRMEEGRIDVNPKAGSVLIFQHDGLYHEGATVHTGTKYTMRTDILYEWVPDTDKKPRDKSA